MIPGTNKAIIAEMAAWIAAATTDEERETREKGVTEALFDGADEAEGARITKLIGEVEAEANKPAAAQAAAPEPVPTRKRRPPVAVYSPERAGYLRASREEGTGAEARGTPFFGSTPSAPAPRAGTKDTLEQLQRHLAARRLSTRNPR